MKLKKILIKILSNRFVLALLIITIGITIYIKFCGDKNYNQILSDRCINDVTQINPLCVAKIIHPISTLELADSVKNSAGPISIGGGKYSMGGQTGYENSLHIDMRDMDSIIQIDTTKKEITVQAGIRWREIQKAIDPYNLSIKVMQTYSNFTVGGSISVNCHGRYIGYGPISSTVKNLKLVLADGSIINANHVENSDLFRAGIGGYGGIGIITEATLELVDNSKVKRQTEIIEATNYTSYFEEKIKTDSNIIFQNGDLYPPHYSKVNSVSWSKTEEKLTDNERLIQEGETYWIEPIVLNIVSWGDFGKWFRQHIIDPIVFFSDKVKWRNKEASYDVMELEPKSRENYTYVLQEYFIPVNNISLFIPKMKAVFEKHNVNVLNVSIRHAHKDSLSYLAWAKEEVFAFVVYYKQGTNQDAKEKVRQWTVEMTDSILKVNGRWYLPYQPHASIEQFQKGYIKSEKYFELKNKYDPNYRFRNKLIDKYYTMKTNITQLNADTITGYKRAEEQSILTIPEWFLVFNPEEYSGYIANPKNNPSNFPFFKSIDDYWKLYDRSLKLVSKEFPKNAEYITMLNIIGTSVTVEYLFKGIYEGTIGKLFSLFSEETISEEEKLIIEANKAYSKFIYNTAWYEFKFTPWIKNVWNAHSTKPHSQLRKWERTIFFSLEFTFKAIYSSLLGYGAKLSYEPAITDIFVNLSTKDTLSKIKNLRIIQSHEESKIVAIKRWGDFTEAMKELAFKNVKIDLIGGNDEIAVSIVKQKKQNIEFQNILHLHDLEMTTDSPKTRSYYYVPVSELLSFIKYCSTNNVSIEHIYDY